MAVKAEQTPTNKNTSSTFETTNSLVMHNAVKDAVNGYVTDYAKFNRPNKHLRKIKKRELLIRQWVLQKIQILTIFRVYFSLIFHICYESVIMFRQIGFIKG